MLYIFFEETNEILQWETGELRDVIKSNMEAGWTQPQRLDSSDSVSNSLLNPFRPEFTIVIFIHYKPRIAVAIPDL